MKGKLKELFEFIEKEVSFSEETDSTIASTNNIGTYTENYASAPQAPVSQTSASPLQGRIFCDTAPILERYWAWRTGLGWIGKNTHLIIPHAGSCFFLGEIILDREADNYDSPQRNQCGSCTRCLDACPTKRWKPLSGSIPRDVFLILPLSIVGNFRSIQEKNG